MNIVTVKGGVTVSNWWKSGEFYALKSCKDLFSKDT